MSELYFCTLSRLIYTSQTMRESYSYFQGHFRNAQVNRSLKVRGDLEPRVSVLAPTLFSLGGVPIAVPKVQPKVPAATQEERAALAPRGSDHPRRRGEQRPVLQTASVPRRLRRWWLHLRRRRQQDPRSDDGIWRPAPRPQQPGHRPRGDQAARIRVDARRDERAVHRIHPSGPEGRPLDEESAVVQQRHRGDDARDRNGPRVHGPRENRESGGSLPRRPRLRAAEPRHGQPHREPHERLPAHPVRPRDSEGRLRHGGDLPVQRHRSHRCGPRRERGRGRHAHHRARALRPRRHRPEGELPQAPPSAHAQEGHRPDLRRGPHRLPPRLRRRPGVLRHPSGYDDVRQDRRRRVPARGLRGRGPDHERPRAGPRLEVRHVPRGDVQRPSDQRRRGPQGARDPRRASGILQSHQRPRSATIQWATGPRGRPPHPGLGRVRRVHRERLLHDERRDSELPGHAEREHASMVELVHPLPREQRPLRNPEHRRAAVHLYGAHGGGHRMGPRGRRQCVRGDWEGSPAAQGKGADGPAAGRRRAGGRIRRRSNATERVEGVPTPPESESDQLRARVPSAYSMIWMPRPRAESSLKYGNGSNAISGGMTPFRLTNPSTIHWAAIEGGTPVSTTPPPTFHFLCGHVTASYRKVTGCPSFSPTTTHRWISTSSSGSFGLGSASITFEVTSYGRTLVPSTTVSSRLARPRRTRVAIVSRNACGNATMKSISCTPFPIVFGIVASSE